MKNGSAKRRFRSAAVACFCCLIAGMWFSSCAERQVQPGLGEYQARNMDERRVVQLTLALQSAFNAADARAVLSLYSRDAGIMIDLTGERKGVLLTKKEYAPKLTAKMSKPSYRNCSYLFHFLEPLELFIDGDDAVMTVPLEVNGTRCHYREKAIFYFAFVKTPAGWRISKSTWEVLESTHPKFREPGRSS